MLQDELAEVVSFFHSFQLDALLFVNCRMSALAAQQLQFHPVKHGVINWWREDHAAMYFSVDHAALECVAVVGRRNIEVSIAMALRDCFFECLTIRWQYDEHSVLPRDVAAKRLIVSFWTDVNVAGLIALLDRFRFINELCVKTALTLASVEGFLDTAALTGYCNGRGIQLKLNEP